MGSKILLIDDDLDFCESTKIMLTNAGYEVMIAHDGLQGIEMGREKKPDLILLDVVMPGKDGYIICRELKDDPHTCSIPVIIMTSLASPQEDYIEKIAKHHKADALLDKPFRKEQLLEQIGKLHKPLDITKSAMGTKKRLLIVDDDADFANALETMLKPEDYDIYIAESGIEGLKLAQTFHPDLIILDVMLPDKDGYTVCYELKKDPATHDIPVLILTALPQKISKPAYAQNLAKNHLADAYGEKPIKADRLLTKIAGLLNKKADP